MKIQTLLQADPQLDPVAGPLEPWPQTRAPPSERIPPSLWEHAVA